MVSKLKLGGKKFIRVILYKSSYNGRALRSAGYLETFSPELKPIKDTKVENIFRSSSVFGQPDMQLIVAQKMRINSSHPLTQNLAVVPTCFNQAD